MNEVNKSLLSVKVEKLEKIQEKQLEEIKDLVIQGQNLT